MYSLEIYWNNVFKNADKISAFYMNRHYSRIFNFFCRWNWNVFWRLKKLLTFLGISSLVWSRLTIWIMNFNKTFISCTWKVSVQKVHCFSFKNMFQDFRVKFFVKRFRRNMKHVKSKFPLLSTKQAGIIFCINSKIAWQVLLFC